MSSNGRSAPPVAPRTIAYLTGYYACASHRFIHREVAALRDLGHTVYTFSLREPGAGDLAIESVRREYEATEHIQAAGAGRLLLASVTTALRRPGRVARATRLALQIRVPGVKGWLWSLAYVAEAVYLARRMQELQVQHLHGHFGDAPATVAMLASLLAGVPYSLTLHGPMEFDKPTLLCLDEKVRRSAFTAAISAYGRSQIFRWIDPADWERVEVVRCGLERALLSHPRVPVPAARRLLCVGRLCEAKGQLLLVEAAARLAAEGVDFELVLVGDGPMRPRIERRIAQHRLQRQVVLTGWMSPDGVRDAILSARALVLPSFAEGLPVVLLEALALGRPVITTYVAGIPELVEHGVSGWLVPAGTLEPLVVAMREALDAPAEWLEQMGQTGAARVVEQHDVSREGARLAALFARNPGDRSSPAH
jgi:glycosyltransferase involved in cell wall biosynthesis